MTRGAEAPDGLAAIAALALTPFDVILMDIRMPGLSGPTTAAKVRSTPDPNQNIPILAFPADVDMAVFEGAASVL